jgi:hypothetical protein
MSETRAVKIPRWVSRKEAMAQASELAGLVLQKVDSPEEARAFVDKRFRDRLATHMRMAPLHGLTASALNIVAITGGVAASSLAAAGEATSGWVIGLGLLVAAASAVNQIGKFGQRAAVRFRAANALRQEGWDFVVGRGRYLTLSGEAAFGAFYDAIWQHERPAEAIAEKADATP